MIETQNQRRLSLPNTPPHNYEAEQGLLGILLCNNAVYDDIAGIVDAQHFYYPVHGDIFAQIKTMINKGQTASPISMKNIFENDPQLTELGGGIYLAELAGSIVSKVNAADYARQIKECADRRQLIDGLLEIVTQTYSTSVLDYGQPLEITNQFLNEFIGLSPAQSIMAKDAMTSAYAFMRAVKSGQIKPAKTGINGLDTVMNGFFPTDLIVIAGRPGMGKTALALTIAKNMALSGTPAVFFSLEMGAEQLAMRLYASETDVDVSRQRSMHALSDYEWHSLDEARAKYQNVPLHIEDCAGVTLSHIISRARKMKRIHGEFVLFIDYLGLIKPERTHGVNMVHQIAEITAGLKALAKELGIPVVLLSQLSREVEKREDKRPVMADLRDSGAIEQDADAILFCYRREYYLSREEPQRRESEGEGKFNERMADYHSDLESARGRAEVIMAKHRHGQARNIHLGFDGAKQLFHDGGLI